MAARSPKTSIPINKRHLGGPQEIGRGTMDRLARRKYFERLCALRDTYRELGPDDTRSVISIESMIERAGRLIDRPASPLIATSEHRDHAN
jgi:hypothetical protein